MSVLALAPRAGVWAVVAVAAVGTALVTVWQPLVGLALGLAALTFALTFRWPGLGLALALLTLIIGQVGRIPLFGSEVAILPNDVLIPLVVLAWLARQLVDRRLTVRASPLRNILLIVSGVLVLSLVVAWLSGAFSNRQLLVAGSYILRWFEYLALFFLARSVVRPNTLWSWLVFFGLITLALAGLGFLQLSVVPDFSAYVPQGWDPHVGRLLATWFDPNFLAGFLGFAVVLFLSLATERVTGRWFSLGVAAVAIVALVLTFSRSGYLGFMVGFGVLAIVRARHFLSLGVLALLVTFLFVPRVQERVIGIRSLDETAQLRIESWRNALEVIADHPWLGVGYNTYRYVQVRYGFLDDVARHSAGGSDSSLLTIAVTTGVVGLMVFLALLARMLQSAWMAARLTRDPTVRALGYGFVAGLLGLIVHGQFVNGLLYPHLLEVQWVMLGLLLGCRDQEKRV